MGSLSGLTIFFPTGGFTFKKVKSKFFKAVARHAGSKGVTWEILIVSSAVHQFTILYFAAMNASTTLFLSSFSSMKQWTSLKLWALERMSKTGPSVIF